jgi:hypothetical protein
MYYMVPQQIVKRRKSWIEFAADHHKLSIDVTITPTSYALFANGKLSYHNAKAYVPAVEIPVASTNISVAAATVVTSGEFKRYYYQDFLLREGNTAEQPLLTSVPVGTATLLHTDTLIEPDGQDPLLDAEEA